MNVPNISVAGTPAPASTKPVPVTTKLSYANYTDDNYQWPKPCWHDGDDVVWKYGETQFIVCDKTGCDPFKADVVLDLNYNVASNRPDRKVIDGAPTKYLALNKLIPIPKKAPAEIVSFAWPDMGVIPAPLAFWTGLLEMLPHNGTVMITCHGGHGRSGTALACLMVASGHSAKWAIETIRERHCKKAIETKGQEAYIHSIDEHSTEDGDEVAVEIIETTNKSTLYEYCVYCARNFREPSAVSDTCTDCARERKLGADVCDVCKKPAGKNNPLRLISEFILHDDCTMPADEIPDAWPKKVQPIPGFSYRDIGLDHDGNPIDTTELCA